MTKAKYLLAAAAVALIGTWSLSTLAQAPDPHHPEGGAAAQATPQMPPTTKPGMAGQAGMTGGMNGQQGMMAGTPMMDMGSMMNMMQMMSGGDAAGMGMIEHVEGRIAFLRAELKITNTQAGVWDAFAVSLRTNAQNLGTARGAMMGQMAAGKPQALTLTQRLDAQERWLTARLDGTRAIKVAFAKLYNVLTPDQKKTADELLPPHMGMAMMATGMSEQKTP